jgi:hypothetical protein
MGGRGQAVDGEGSVASLRLAEVVDFRQGFFEF